jgi:hypothetical protein
MEKCYRDIQNRGQIARLNILELFILIGVPLLLFPIFTLLKLNTFIIMVIEAGLYILFRLADKISTFEYGMASYVYSKFIWPQKLSAFALDEKQYLKSEDEPVFSPPANGKSQLRTASPGAREKNIVKNGRPKPDKNSVHQAAQRVKKGSKGNTRKSF